MKETYVSPKMDFEDVMVDNAVANTCWGYHGTGTNLFADLNGKDTPGYLSFQIGGGKCTLNLVNVMYYAYKGADPVKANADQIASLEAFLSNAGGESGNPFAGEGTDVIVGEPGGTIS